jgi:broad specificity polyphosphatase/5'/3'-nucleotidase SurE
MKLFRYLKKRFKKKELLQVNVPMTCRSSAEKNRIIKATQILLEQNIIIIYNGR